MEPDTRIPADLDPATILDGAPEGSNSIREASRSLHQMTAQLSALHDAWEAIDRDPTMPDAGRIHAREALRAKVSAQAIKLADSALSRAAAGLEWAQGQLAAAVAAPALTAAEARELRDYVRSLPDPVKRSAFIAQRAAKGDRALIAAVFQGAPYLSGLEDEGFDALRTEAHAKLAPEETAEAAAYQRTLERIAGALQRVLRHYGEPIQGAGEVGARVVLRREAEARALGR